MKYTFINHGYMGSNVENWFTWFKNTMDDENNLCIIPQYPIDKNKHFYDYWKKVLDTYYDFGYINSDTILIGHSSGCAFTMKYIFEKKLQVNKLILVSGFNNYYSVEENDFHNAVNKSFYLSDDELNIIRQLCNEIICIYGDDDPFIPQSVFSDLSTRLNAKTVIIHNGGHLNTTSGYDKFEIILKYVK